ncbi:MAG: dihydroxyacetone kinase subunit DhaK [Actinomycetota bacterium]|nr:dihydroxyacetone kinase subunit DhaK [Actinomycetota bacterium]
MVEEMVDGFLSANDDIVRRVGRRSIARVASPIAGKVGIVVGGGSGHLPAFAGYVGQGMADGAAFGNVFASPPARPVVEATTAVDSGAGVLYLYGNYAGDCLNFDKAQDQCREMGMDVRTVVLNDDVASAPIDQADRRRGIGGLFWVFRIAGAKAEQMASLDEVFEIATRANANTRTVGVGLTSCTVPANGRPTFHLEEDEMELGLGIHGEPGIKRQKVAPVDDIVDAMMDMILGDLDYSGSEVALSVNGLGGTPAEELYVVYRKAKEICDANGLRVLHKNVGEMVTALEMAGASISLVRLDDEMGALLDSTVNTCMYKKP